MSLPNILCEFFPKQLVPLFLSYLIDEININEIDTKLLVMVMRTINVGKNGQESDNFPKMTDIRIFIISLKFYPNSEIERLKYYVKQNSEYLVKKLFNTDFLYEILYAYFNNDEIMKDLFDDILIKSGCNEIELLYRTCKLARKNYSNSKVYERLGEIGISKLDKLNATNFGYFDNLFWFSENEDGYVKVLESGYLSDKNIEERAIRCINNYHDCEHWKDMQKSLMKLLKDSNLKKRFAETFKI